MEVLYKGKDTDDIILLNDDIYLSKEQELIGCNADMMAYNEVDIVNSDYIVTLDDLGENRIINVEFLAKGLVKVLSKEKIDLINDAYCPSQPIDLIKSNHDIGLIHGMVNTEVIIKDNISSISGLSIVAFKIDFPISSISLSPITLFISSVSF